MKKLMILAAILALMTGCATVQHPVVSEPAKVEVLAGPKPVFKVFAMIFILNSDGGTGLTGAIKVGPATSTQECMSVIASEIEKNQSELDKLMARGGDLFPMCIDLDPAIDAAKHFKEAEKV